MKITIASILFSFMGPFDVGSNVLIDNQDIKKHLSDAIGEAFEKNGINSKDNFSINNISAFLFKGNALSFSANRNRVDVLCQKMNTGADLDGNDLIKFIADFISLLLEKTNILLSKMVLCITGIPSFSGEEEKQILSYLFHDDNAIGKIYLGQTVMEETTDSFKEVEVFVKTISKGLVKENNIPKTGAQFELRTNNLNQIPRFNKVDVNDFLEKGCDFLFKQLNSTFEFLMENENKK